MGRIVFVPTKTRVKIHEDDNELCFAIRGDKVTVSWGNSIIKDHPELQAGILVTFACEEEDLCSWAIIINNAEGYKLCCTKKTKKYYNHFKFPFKTINGDINKSILINKKDIEFKEENGEKIMEFNVHKFFPTALKLREAEMEEKSAE